MAEKSVNPDRYTHAVVKSPPLKELSDSWLSLCCDDNVADELSVTFIVTDENDTEQELTGGVKKLEYEGFLVLVDLIDRSGETWEINFRRSGPARGTGTAFNPMAMRMANLSRPRR